MTPKKNWVWVLGMGLIPIPETHTQKPRKVRYQPYPYRSDDGRENQNPGPIRSTRGGGHDSSEEEITTTQRGRNLSRNPKAGHHNIGFRCAA